MRNRSIAAAGLALGLIAASAAKAGPVTITISEAGYGSETFVAPTTGPSAGVLNFTGSFGTFASISVTAEGYPASGTVSQPFLSSTNITINSGASAGTLSIWVSQQDYTDKYGALYDAHFGGVLNDVNSKNATLVANAFMDSSNKINGSGTTLASQAYGGNTDAFSNDLAANDYPGTSYSLSSEFVLTALAGTRSNFNATISANPLAPSVPEPSSLALFASGLLALPFLRRARR